MLRFYTRDVSLLIKFVIIIFMACGVETESGFSGWTAWSCDVSCGSGISYRMRYCYDYNKVCDGSTKQTRPGCAKFPCPTHDRLPKKLWAAASKVLGSMHYNFVVNTTGTVVLRCNNGAARKFDRYYPRASVRWIKNEQPLLIDPSRFVYDRRDLLIQSIYVSDTGLYQCTIEWEKNKQQTIGLYAISVQSPKIQIRTKISKKLHIRCNNRPLISIFGRLKTDWLLNGKKFNASIKFHVEKDHTLKIKHVTKNHEGLWTCVVVKDGKKWITNTIKVHVEPEPNALEKLLSNPVVVWGSIVTVMVILAITVSVCTYRAKRDKQTEDNFDNDPQFTNKIKLILGLPEEESIESRTESNSFDLMDDWYSEYDKLLAEDDASSRDSNDYTVNEGTEDSDRENNELENFAIADNKVEDYDNIDNNVNDSENVANNMEDSETMRNYDVFKEADTDVVTDNDATDFDK